MKRKLIRWPSAIALVGLLCSLPFLVSPQLRDDGRVIVNVITHAIRTGDTSLFNSQWLIGAAMVFTGACGLVALTAYLLRRMADGSNHARGFSVEER